MRFAFISLLAVVVYLPAAEQKGKKQKPPDLEVVEAVAHREDGRVTVDGRVRNSGEKAIQGLVLLFDFTAPGKAVITTRRFQAEEEMLEPGREASFHAVMVDPVRAVEFQVNGTDRNERELRVAKAGPFPIE